MTRVAGAGARWLGLEAGSGPGRFRLPLARRLCAPQGALFGGAVLGAIVAAAEEHGQRPALHAHAQLRSAASGEGELELAVDEPAGGRRLAYMSVSATQGDRVCATAQVTAAAASSEAGERSLVDPPSAPEPDACPEREYADPDPTSINGTLDVRVARASDDGCILWARPRREFPVCAATLAVLADHVPYVARRVVGKAAPVVSVDSALHVFGIEPTDWVLLDVSIVAIRGALGYGRVGLRSRGGTLLAEGSQSFRIL